MIIVLGASEAKNLTGTKIKPFLAHFGPGTIISGPIVENIRLAHGCVQPTLSAFKASALVATAERVMTHADLIAARVLIGDQSALQPLMDQLQTQIKSDVLETLATYLEQAPTIEGCARLQFVHVNTVRYRLKRVSEVTGFDPMNPQDALTLRMALMLGRSS